MDKYTVDLDKVLNDFEYSEYSLESAKVNKTIQDEPPNSSFNTNHCSRHDTAVKHSINNVFHSLNEYLSSDITPKKIENVEKNLKTIDISGGPQSTSFLMKPQHVASQKIQAAESYHKLVDPPSKDLTQDVLQEDINRKEFSNIFNKSLVDMTDTYSDTCAINSDQEVVNDNAEVNFNDVSLNMNTKDNKCLLDETPEEENSLCDPQMINQSVDTTQIITNFNDNLTDEILVDLRCNEEVNVENNINAENKFMNDVNEENKPVENYEDFVNMQKEFCSINTIPKTNDVNSENEKDLNSIQDSLTNKHDEIKTCSIMESDVKVSVGDVKNNDIEKIGFDSNVELDEENIEQYFKDLEEELGIQDQQEKNVKIVEETAVDVNEKNQLSIQYSEVIVPECEISEKEHSQLEITEEKNVDIEPSIQEHSIESHKQSDEEEKEIPIQTDNSNEEIVQSNPEKPEVSIEEHKIEADERKDQTVPDEDHSVKKDMDIIEEKEAQTQMKESEVPKESSNNENIQTVDVNSTDTPNTAENQSTEDSQESEKNSRPQNLSLVEETQETTRKISLIGEPGSTPYNNLYSTKDYVKTISDGSGDTNTARATSPTYSDVSTDSVSSSSSDDTAEYNDAVSEVQNEKQVLPIEKSTAFFKEIMQNNMVHTVETSRSDVTMDKDFKNNLKTGNVRTDGGPSTSCGQSEETGEAQSDRQDLEGACALEVQNNASENQENVEKTEEQGLGEARNALISVEWLGKQAPLWLPDSVATSCLHCNMKFTVIKRRHHCRACGLVLCSKCCSLKFRLEYLNADARVCTKCFEILDNDNNSNSGSEMSQESSSPSRNPTGTQEGSNQPNPNNPLEYCSTIPPTQQAEAGATAVPSVMVPVGVLKRKGSNKGRSNKSVMFCDGIRPGSDLTNLDTDFNYSENQKTERSKKSPDKSSKSGRNLNMIDTETKSFIPNDEKSLPPTVTIFKTDIKYSPCANNASVVEMLRNESLTFALQSNVFVHVKIINMDCCISRIAWCFSTEGLINVGQDEIVILLEFVENESVVPKEIFVHLNYIYLEAVKGSSVKELGMSLHPSSPFLGSKNHFGFIFIRPTFQCLQNVIIPKEPYLIGILIHRWETPWAKLFPLRLVLRLGAEYKYYPSPIISTRDRDSVFVEIGHTIINLLADFRNFSYSLPQIRGLTIHMEDRNTTVTIPENRYDQVLKSLSNSSDHILAFAGNFSSIADSHLVCIQDTQSATNNYSTHAINICNQPRKVTGASFIVFNGALKSTSGLTAKSNIVEDGLMIQILPEHMLQVRDSLKNMKNHTIKCGCVNEESDETVTIVWGEPDTTFNVGVLSPIDNKNLTGVPSIRVHNGKDYTCNSGNRLIRWTEVFITQKGDDSAKNQDPVDISKISENISKATCQALVKYLDLLVSNSFYKIGLRAHIHVENVSYSAGSNNVKLPPIYMKSLDNELIPVLHRIASNNVTEQPIILELIFRILNI